VEVVGVVVEEEVGQVLQQQLAVVVLAVAVGKVVLPAIVHPLFPLSILALQMVQLAPLVVAVIVTTLPLMPTVVTAVPQVAKPS